MPDPFSQAIVRDYVKLELGSPPLELEMGDSQIDQAADNALRMFNQYMCETQLRVANEQTGSVVIQLEDDIRGVVAVKFLHPESTRSMTTMNVFEIINRMVYPSFSVSDWYLFKSFYEMFQQIRGAEPDWKWDPFSKKLYVDAWSGPFDIYYAVSTNLTLEALGFAKDQYRQRFLDLAVARAKQIQARIQGKFTQSIPGPVGPVTTDAESLRREGKEKEVEIKEWLETICKFTQVLAIG